MHVCHNFHAGKVNIVSEDDALVTVFDVDPSHTVGTLKEHISYIY